jgi:hypothetical protein
MANSILEYHELNNISVFLPWEFCLSKERRDMHVRFQRNIIAFIADHLPYSIVKLRAPFWQITFRADQSEWFIVGIHQTYAPKYDPLVYVEQQTGSVFFMSQDSHSTYLVFSNNETNLNRNSWYRTMNSICQRIHEHHSVQFHR